MTRWSPGRQVRGETTMRTRTIRSATGRALRTERLTAAAALFLLAQQSPADVEWALFDRSCDRGTSSFEVACGDYGVFHFVDVVDPPGCMAVADGVGGDLGYPKPMEVQQFEETPTPIGVLRAPGQTQGAQPPADYSMGGPFDAVVQLPEPNVPWLALIDFASTHGITTHWLADSVAGSQPGGLVFAN